MAVTIGDMVLDGEGNTLTVTFVGDDVVVASSSADSIERSYPYPTFDLAMLLQNYVDAGGDFNPVFLEALWDGTGPVFYTTFVPDSDWLTGRTRLFAAPPALSPDDWQAVMLADPASTIPTQDVGDDVVVFAPPPGGEQTVYEITYLENTPVAGHMDGVAVGNNDPAGDLSFEYDSMMVAQVTYPVLGQLVFMEVVWDNDDVANPVPVFTTYVADQTWWQSGRAITILPTDLSTEDDGTGQDGVLVIADFVPIVPA